MGFRGPQVQILSPRPTAQLIDLNKIRSEDPERLLTFIRRWWAEHPELADHPRVALSDWLSRSRSELSFLRQVGIAAARSVENLNDVRIRVGNLGQRKYAAAVPTFVDIWQRCAVEPIRTATGHALFAIDTPAARAALREGIDDHEHFDRYLALLTLFTDNGSPWDNVSPLFEQDRLATPAGVRVAADALGFLGPSSFSREGPSWRLESAHRLIGEDRRWLDLCVRFRGHPTLGYAARQALRYSDPKVTTPALDAAAKAAASRQRPKRLPPVPGSLIARYNAGEHRQVWRELATADPRDVAWREEAEPVSEATMASVLRNAERLVDALVARRWPIASEAALSGVPGDVDLRLNKLEEILARQFRPH
jgi:hypothetical protein